MNNMTICDAATVRSGDSSFGRIDQYERKGRCSIAVMLIGM